MKKIILIIFPIIAIIGMVLFYKSEHRNLLEVKNSSKEPLEWRPNEVQCPQCNMFLVQKEFTAEAITPDYKTHFFDDVGCMILWAEEKAFSSDTIYWIYSQDSKRWIDAKKAYYSINDKTPMEYGFAGYEKNKLGFIDYETMRLRMLRGETMLDPKIRKKILGE